MVHIETITCKVEVVCSSISQAPKVLHQACSTKKDSFAPNAASDNFMICNHNISKQTNNKYTEKWMGNKIYQNASWNHSGKDKNLVRHDQENVR